MNIIPYSQQYGGLSNQQIIFPQPNFAIQQQMPFPQTIGGIQVIYAEDPIAELANCTSLLIKQQPEFFEALTGYETQNRYHVFGQSAIGMKYLFKCKERSGWFMRNCCPSNQREFDMEINHISTINNMAPTMTKNFANAFKPFKCTICCLCRPELFIKLAEGQINIGTIKHIFTICDPEFHIFDERNQIKYIVNASCCQCGLLCANNFCGKLSEAIFNILDPGNRQIIGKIVKHCADLSELATDADSYQINFPSIASPNDKLLLMSLGLMIDYQYFETDSTDDRKKRGKRGYNYGYY